MTEPTQFGQAPAQFGQAPQSAPAQFGQAPAFGQAPQSAPAQFGQAPAQPAPQFGQAPAFGATATKATTGNTYAEVTALELGWITQEEATAFAQYENNYQAVDSAFEARYPIQIMGTVTFSALAAPFLPKEDRKNNGRLWEIKISLKDIQILGEASPFAKYVFAKRLRRNNEGELTYQQVTNIIGSSPQMTRDQARQLAMDARTKTNKPAPAWPVPFVDINDNTRQQLLSEHDFATDGSQQVALSLSLVHTSNQVSVARYMWYKPYLQGVMADFDNLHFATYSGSVFRNAQDHALEMARKAMSEANQQDPAQPAQPGFGQPAAPQGFGQPAQPGFGQPAAPQGFGQPAAPQGFGQPAPQGFGQPAVPQGFGQPAQPGFGQPAAPQGFGQPAAPQGFGQPASPVESQPFAQPFANNDPANPFA